MRLMTDRDKPHGPIADEGEWERAPCFEMWPDCPVWRGVIDGEVVYVVRAANIYPAPPLPTPPED